MSEMIDKAVTALSEKLGDEVFDGSVRFEIEGEGSVRVDESGVSADDSEADVTLTADRDTFEGLLTGDVNPTSAFMTGQLKVDGDMSLAMKLGSILS